MSHSDNHKAKLADPVSRLTAQASYNVISLPTAKQQLVALTIKNIKIRIRDLAQTINAVFQPVWMMLILVFLHLSAKGPAQHMSAKALPFLSDDTCVSTTACTYFGYTGLPATDPIISELAGFFTASEPKSVVPKFYTNEAEMTAAYDASPRNFVVGVVFYGPSTNLTTPSATGGSPADLYQYTILANHTSYSNSEYLNSRFATAQVYVERAAINLRRKANGKPGLSSPLPLKTDPGIANSGVGRTFISYANFVGLGSSINQGLNAYYVIFCFQAVWVGVLSVLVEEKKKKIRMAMTMMGMHRDPYLISLWLMQNIQNLATCALMVMILFVGKIFTNTNAFIVWLILVLFSFSCTAFGTIASVMVADPKKSNTASFMILIWTAALGGVTFGNLSAGPCGKALWMLAIDAVLFTFIAWYLDAVFPGEFGNALPFDFFLRPSYWGFGQYRNAAEILPHDLQRSTETLDPVGAPAAKEHSDMFEQVDISHIPVEDRSIIVARGIRKVYSTGPGWAYSIPLYGLFVRLFYPPKSERKTGPFSGVQHQEVVKGLDLEVHKNEILGFLGHNGAGKTTSLSIIMGMVKSSAGSVVVNGHLMPGSDAAGGRKVDMRTLTEVQKQMGVCPQHDVLFETLSAWETVQLYATIKGVKVLGRTNAGSADGSSSRSQTSQQLLDEYLDHLLEDVYLKEKKHERVATFSGGMKRKLSVALAFLGDPKVVLLDEPTTGMDVFTRKQVWQLMQDSKAGRAILLTTHSMEEADALGDRIAILSDGQLQTMGSSLFLKNRFGLGYRLSLEKRRVMLADQRHAKQKQNHYHNNEIQATNLDEDRHEVNTILFDEERTTAIVQQHFPDATIDVNTATDITYVLPTTGTVEQRNGRSAQEYIQDKKAALPGLFAHLDSEIAANQLGVKSVGLSLTTLEEVFVSLQEQEEAEKLAREEAENNNTDTK
ncbi:ATP-binding cassette sub- A member 5 [Mortierella sp. GBA39]|nr:ATP-binding cassette sub- A member 5 [Mortierella sp. GBA39]